MISDRPEIRCTAIVLLTLSLAACSSGSKSSGGATTATSQRAATTNGSSSESTAPADTASGGGSSKIDGCSLLTAAEASSLAGVTYTSATSSSGGNECVYASTQAPTPMTVLFTPNAGGASDWTEELATLQEGGGETPKAIAGVGDRAAGVPSAFAVQSGKWIVEIDGGDSSSSGGVFTKSIACAKKIISGLP